MLREIKHEIRRKKIDKDEIKEKEIVMNYILTEV